MDSQNISKLKGKKEEESLEQEVIKQKVGRGNNLNPERF